MDGKIQIFENKAEKTATIDIDGYIGFDFMKYWNDEDEKQNTKERIKEDLKKITELKAEKILVNINSPGGNANDGISIHDALAEHPAKVITKIYGFSASAATIISQAGDERKMSDNAFFLAHIASTGNRFNRIELKTHEKDLATLDDRIANLYAKRSGKPKEEILEVMERANGRGEWLTSDEALDLGFIDEIFEPKQAAAFADPSILLNFGYPELPEQILNRLPAPPEKDLENKLPEQTPNIKVEENNSKSQTMEDKTMTEGKENFIKMKGIFGAEKAAEYFENDMSLEDAALDFVGHLKNEIKELTDTNDAQGTKINELETENKDLKAKVDQLEDGADPIPGTHTNDAKDGEIIKAENGGAADQDTFMDKVDQIIKAENCTRADAISQAVDQFPELHEEYKKNGESQE